jgi:hypothetical protein
LLKIEMGHELRLEREALVEYGTTGGRLNPFWTELQLCRGQSGITFDAEIGVCVQWPQEFTQRSLVAVMQSTDLWERELPLADRRLVPR